MAFALLSPLQLFSLFSLSTVFLTILWALKQFLLPNPLDKVKGPPSPSIWKGHLGLLFSTHPGVAFQRELTDTYGRVVLLKGECGSRQLYVSDPKAIHTISVKEQDIFQETSSFISGNRLVFGQGLVSTLGEQHRRQRKVLTPAFNMKHLREIVPIFNSVSYKLRDRLLEEIRQEETEVNMLRWLSRTALELVGLGGLGYEFNALDGDGHPYTDGIKRVGPSLFALALPRRLLPYVDRIGSPWFRRKLLEAIPSQHVRTLLASVDVMWQTTEEVFRRKDAMVKSDEEAVLKDHSSDASIMSVLKRANASLAVEERLSDIEVKGQVNTLVLAANETTSRTIARIIHILSLNHEAQKKLRAEIIQAVQMHGELDYDQLNDLQYLDAVMRETLRLYPPFTSMARTCRKDTVLPLYEPIETRDGQLVNEVPVPKGTDVHIGIMCVNTDKAIWGSDAREWKPERWMQKLPASVESARIPGVLSHQMTFLAGSRSCIGFKFAQLEIKSVLVVLLSNFSFDVADKQPEWVLSGIMQPIVPGTTHPSMPMRVAPLKPANMIE